MTTSGCVNRSSCSSRARDGAWRPSLAREFLAWPRAKVATWVVLDLSLPDLNGLDLQTRVAVDRKDTPIIFLTGQGDIATSVLAMKAGAVEFLTKPVRDDVLLSAIRDAIDRSRTLLEREAEIQALRDRHTSLSRREREVMERVVTGRLNKQVAVELGITEITVKAHRGRLMRKMRADSVADLVRMAVRLWLAPPRRVTGCETQLVRRC